MLALDELFDTYAAALYRFAARLMGPGADAEDAVQNVLLSVLARNGFDPARGSLRAYLFGAVRNQARKLRRVTNEELAEAMPSPQATPDRSYALEETRQAVAGALARLSWAQREVLLLSHYEELSLKEIATALDLELAAVKSRLHRAREALRVQLQAYAPHQEGDPR